MCAAAVTRGDVMVKNVIPKASGGHFRQADGDRL